MKLSERETAALAALAASDTALSGNVVAEAMRAAGIKTNGNGTHQTCNALARKDLAASTFVDGPTGAVIGYELTDAGRKAATGLRSRP